MNVKMLVPWSEVADAIRQLPLVDIGGVQHIDLHDLSRLMARWMQTTAAPAMVEQRAVPNLIQAAIDKFDAVDPLEDPTVDPNVCRRCHHPAHPDRECGYGAGPHESGCACGTIAPIAAPIEQGWTTGRLMRDAPPVE